MIYFITVTQLEQTNYLTWYTLPWWSVLLVEKTGIRGENHRPVGSHWQNLSHNVVSSTSRLNGIRTHTFFKIRSRKKFATRPQTTVPFYLRVRWHESECPFYFFVVWTSASVIKFYSYVEEMIVIWLSCLRCSDIQYMYKQYQFLAKV
jgi:hypothetical protein